MAINSVIDRLGRRLRLGVVGGGGDAFIGPVHRIAARLDDQFEIVAGVLSSNADKARAQAAALGIPRSYPDVLSLIAAEIKRPDGVDALAIMTPNDTHVAYSALALDAGLDVICDKPLANDSQSARELAAHVKKSGRIFCLTHNYSGYPMIREARAAIASGELGTVHLLQVIYLQGRLGSRIEDKMELLPERSKWKLDPARGGLSHVLIDIGVHAHQLATYVTGSRVHSVLADVGAAVAGRTLHDTASVILRMEGGARGVLLTSKAASGESNRLAIGVYGSAGGLCWEQDSPNELRVMPLNGPVEIRYSGMSTLHPLAKRSIRLPSGHPEALLEAFANIYRDFAELVAARISGTAPDPLAQSIPAIGDGLEGLSFIDACLASTSSGTWSDCVLLGAS